MGGERPDASKAVGNNDDPRPVGVEVVQCFGAHRKNNLPEFFDCSIAPFFNWGKYTQVHPSTTIIICLKVNWIKQPIENGATRWTLTGGVSARHTAGSYLIETSNATKLARPVI